jgi:hypothetical protein
MTIRLEDYHFYQHAGVDLGALRDAWEKNASYGRTAAGGSTIPMQLARNLFLTPRKTYFRKYMEIFIALEMDFIMPKDRILELYLNNIEWGKGVFGIGAASSYYYKAGVSGLGLDELRRLVTIITNPLRYDVQTFYKSAQMAQRYAFLETRFPDPSAEPMGSGSFTPEIEAQITGPGKKEAGSAPGPTGAGPPAPAASPASQPVAGGIISGDDSASAPPPREIPNAAPEIKIVTPQPTAAAPW